MERKISKPSSRKPSDRRSSDRKPSDRKPSDRKPSDRKPSDRGARPPMRKNDRRVVNDENKYLKLR